MADGISRESVNGVSACDDVTTVEAMLKCARAGDAQAMNRLFEACRTYLAVLARAQAQRRLSAKVDASDIVQETLLDAHRDFARFQGTSAEEWLAWLRAILSHNMAGAVRQYCGTQKRQVQREVAIGQPGGDSSAPGGPVCTDPGETPSQVLMHRERELAVANALMQLSSDYQEVIMLRNLERLSFEEVAARMGRSRPAVQMLWMRAIRKLQEVLPSDV